MEIQGKVGSLIYTRLIIRRHDLKKFYDYFKNIFVITLPVLIVLLIILEVSFRLIIPASNPPGGYFDEKEKVYLHDNRGETGMFTIGRFAETRSQWSINNFGCNYPIDYNPNIDKNLIAVIGDSYIEAFQVDVNKNYPYLLREKLFQEYEVYAFGISGASLSQYLHLSRYINKYFDPDIFIFNISHNDFDESIYELYPNRYHFLQVSFNNGDIIETTPRPNYTMGQYKSWQRAIKKSSLFRYLWYNLKVGNYRNFFLKPEFEANIKPDIVKKQEKMIFSATNYLIRTIKNENANKRIIFIVDAPRTAIYSNSLNDSEVLWMNDMLGLVCNNNNVEFLDLTEYMKEDFQKRNKKFNSEIDNHWNEYGHQFVAGILYDYLSHKN